MCGSTVEETTPMESFTAANNTVNNFIITNFMQKYVLIRYRIIFQQFFSNIPMFIKLLEVVPQITAALFIKVFYFCFILNSFYYQDLSSTMSNHLFILPSVFFCGGDALQGMWDRTCIPLQWKCRDLTTEPPGKCHPVYFSYQKLPSLEVSFGSHSFFNIVHASA